jgi:integrase
MRSGPSEPDITLHPNFEAAMRRYLAGPPGPRHLEQLRRRNELKARWSGWYGDNAIAIASGEQFRGPYAEPSAAPPTTPAPAATRPASRPAAPVVGDGGETISQALEGWIKDLTSNKPRRPDTVKGHRQRVREFTDKFGDLPLTDISRAMAYDFLSGLGRANRTRNNYAMTLSGIFKCAKLRGRFTGENPFEAMRVDDVGAKRDSFKDEELQTLFDALPRDTNPKEHSPATALPWVALISAYSGACLEEICQLSLDDVREEGANGGTVTIFDIHNGDGEHQLKNDEARPRYVPMHSALVRAGLREYITNLRQHGHARLFPGLKRRASKGNKLSPEVGHRFGKTLRKLGLKRSGLCFHSFRNTVINLLKHAREQEADVARVVGHVHPNMTFGPYAEGYRVAGPGLKIAAGVVEKIVYEGLRL